MEILGKISSFVWGPPLIILLVGTGIFLTFRLGFIQVARLGKALKFMFKNEEGGIGEVRSFGALCTALAATIGTGNIVGVSTALVAGGPGALFWMVLAGFFGMATKYAEGLLAIKYRKVCDDGHILGGPFYYIEKGMGSKWKPLAKLFAFFGAAAAVLGIGTITQVNGIANSAQAVFDPKLESTVEIFGMNYSYSIIVTAIVVSVLAMLVLIGGIKRISSVTTVIVPFMAVIYIVVCLSIILFNYDKVGSAFATIFEEAFALKAAAGGALGAFMKALQSGVSRGMFSNESGLGSAPIAAAAAQTKEPARQGLVSMTGTFIDTIILCTMTGLVIMVSGALNFELDGAAVTSKAFAIGLPWSNGLGSLVLMVCLSFFAFTTILGWNYYGEKCLEYLVNGNQGIVKVYRWVYILAVLVGPFITLSAVWTVADIFNGLMAVPNLIAIIALNGVIVYETRDYLKRLDSGKLGKN